jgi:hypothetical protein
MRIPSSRIVAIVVALVTSACMGGTGSGLTGVSGGNGGTGSGGPLVLSYFSQPNRANVGQVMSAVRVVATDSLGNVATTFTGIVTVALASNSTGAGLNGRTTVRASNGSATFGSLSVNRAGTYTLRASASGAAAVTSDPFTITSPGTP